jgi:hypothetical protein
MSEVKPTETPEVAPVAAPSTEVAPVVEPAAVEAKTEEPVTKPAEPTTEETTAGETAAEAPVETTDVPEPPIEPITEGVLETKITSVIPLFIKKQTFYFSDDSIPEDHLGEYLKKEKSKAGHATYAHATQTGKGLLFFGKADKKPTGIVRLDGAEVTTQGEKKFTIKSAGHELQLEAPTAALRERWVHTLKLHITEHEGVHAAIAETEGFKGVLEKLTKPAVAAPVVKKEEPEVKEETETKEEPPVEPEAAKKEGEEETAAKVEEAPAVVPAESSKKEEKRSSSRNRLSKFSFFGKKPEEKEKEPVVEAKDETATTEPTATESAPVIPTEAEVAPTEPVKTEEAPAPIAEGPSETLAETPKEETKTGETSPVTSPKSNRKSFLGGLFNKKEKKVETPVEEEPKPLEPQEPVETAAEPQTITTEAAPAPVQAEVTLPDSSEQAPVEPESKEAKETKEEPTEAPAGRKSSLFGSLRREKSTDGMEDKPRRRISLFGKKDKKVAPTKEETPATEAAPIAETATDVPPTSSEPIKPETEKETPAPAPIPDTLGGTSETEVRDGKIGDVVPAAVTVGKA